MINAVALGLVLSSLAAAGVWSPTAQLQHPLPPHVDLVREGHRVIVVEYERQFSGDVKEAVPLSSIAGSSIGREIQILDAEREKEKFAGAARSREDEAVDAAKKAQEKTSLLKDGITDAVHAAADGAKETASTAREAAEEMAHGIAEHAQEKASEMQRAAMDAVHGAADKARDKASDATSTAKEKLHRTADKTSELEATAVDDAAAVVAETGKNLTDIVIRARGVSADLAAYVAGRQAVRAGAAAVHTLGSAAAFGASVWVTFVSGHVLAAALPRQQLGTVQSKLYPAYFRAAACATAAALVGVVLEREHPLAGAHRLQAAVLLAALGLVMVNMLFLEPKATKAMMERMKMEKEEGRAGFVADILSDAGVTTAESEAAEARLGKVSKRLKQLNGYSSAVNVATLMALTAHLARRVHAAAC